MQTQCECISFTRRLFNSIPPKRNIAPPLRVSGPDAPSHDDAGDWDAAALVAVALDALGLAAGGLCGLDDALDGRDGGGAGSLGHLVLLAGLGFVYLFLGGCSVASD